MVRLVLYANLLLLILIQNGWCLKILGIFPMTSHSHFTIGFRLMKELADRGHEVTFLHSHPQKSPIKDLKDLPIAGLKKILEEGNMADLYALESMPIIFAARAVYKTGNTVTNLTFATAVQQLMKTEQTFDVIVLGEFLAASLMGLSHHYKAPLVYMCAMGSSTWNNNLFGNPEPLSYVPGLLTPYSPHMTFFQRLHNSFIYHLDLIYRHLFYYPKENEILHRYLPDAPHLNELLYNASLILLNSHPSFKDPVPLLPNMIEIGGYHVSEPKLLPKDLKDFLDGAKDGVIYFSMGSTLESADIPIEKRNAIIKALGKVKQKVLWKFEFDDVVVPTNVKIQKWLPQQDILAHPNVKVFVSHGGLLSTIEAIYHGVPILGIPIFGDQKMNIANAIDKGYAVSVPYGELTAENLEKALSEILNNPRYSEIAKKRSKLLHDRPVKPLDTAVYWIEYVARNGRCEHFRSSALDLKWYQRSMLDIIVFLAAIVIILFWVFCYIVNKIMKPRNLKVNKKKKNK